MLFNGALRGTLGVRVWTWRNNNNSFFFADVFWARATDFAKKERLIVVYRNIFTANYHSDCERRMREENECLELNAAMCNIGCSFCCRFLCHILPCPSATTAIQAENMERDIIHAWFRCLLQLPPSHEGLTELTRYPTPPSLREFVTWGRICD